MKKRVSVLLAVLLLYFSVFSQGVMAFELPDPSELGKLASEAASGIADAAGNAGDAIVDAAGQAGEVASGIAGNIGDIVTGAAGQVSDVASGFAESAGEVLSDWGKAAGETADSVKEKLADAGVIVKTSAEELGSATAQKVSELTEQAGETADNAIEIVSGAGDFVVDQTGHVIDLAAVAADYVSSGAAEALHVLQKYGSLLMNLAEEAVSGIDFSKEESWEEARVAVDAAVNKAFEEEIIDREKVSEETIRIVTSVVFGALMYGYQYKNEQITLSEYALSMSEVLIREGLPTGVGFLVSILPINKIPHAESMAKEATYYLISKAYGDEPGDEIEAEEESLLEEAITDPMMTGGWENVPHEAVELPENAQEAFDKATKELDDAEYTAIALLSTQVVAGMNYCILCQITPEVKEVMPSWALVYIYADLEGNAEIMNVYELYIPLHSTPEG